MENITALSLIFILIVIRVDSLLLNVHGKYVTDEKQAEMYLKGLNNRLADQKRKYTEAQWNYSNNINDQTNRARIMATKDFNDFLKKQLIETNGYDWTNFTEYNRRQFEKFANIGTIALNEQDYDQFTKVSINMENVYNGAKLCAKGKCRTTLDQDFSKIVENITDYTELLEMWVNWRDVSGKKLREDYITYYTLGNKAATLNKLPNKVFKTWNDFLLFKWESPDITEQIEKVLKDLKPFYEKIHAYVRMNLNKKYPGKMPNDGTIPAHLLGDIKSQMWSHLMNTIDGIDPHRDVAPINVTDVIKREEYDSEIMLDVSEQFYLGLNFPKLSQTFKMKSVLIEPMDRKIDCQPSAWDFSASDDYRIKMCTNINMDDLIAIHRQIGRIQYFMQYKNQPTIFKEGANPGFIDAISDMFVLSVATPQHLERINLIHLDKIADQLDKINLKFQLNMALEKVLFLPFAYLIDKWRLDVYSGNVSSDHMNRHWWKLRAQLQGISPPVKRSENDFDPGAHFHLTAAQNIFKDFASNILQFQFHKKLCSFREKDQPLHKCDISGDHEAGQLLRSMLEKGSSEKWTKQLMYMIGTDKLDVQPLLEYFQPLQTFLDVQLNGTEIGWKYKDIVDNSNNINKNGCYYAYSSLVFTIISMLIDISTKSVMNFI